VGGILPGTDPELAEQTLVIGAHLDHVGKQGDGIYFPGANDNASGAAAVLDVARAFVRGKLQPRLTIVFVLFAGEEQGLCGARHYVAHPVRPLASTVAMLNLDCVACGDSIQVGGGETYPRLWELARKQDLTAAQLTVERTWSGGGADATPFHEAGVPTLYFHTLHGYGHLHSLDDTPETLNPPLYTALAKLAFRTAALVAEGNYTGEVAEVPAEATGL
jgi:aminopeptidase YwaD